MKRLILFTMAGFIVFTAGQVFAGETGHYTNGTSGIKAGSVPPPGMYYLMYNIYYHSDDMKDRDGNTAPIGFEINVYANVHRLIHVTKYKILGADFSWNAAVPITYTDLEINAFGVDEYCGRVGDINLEPFVMEWHNPRWDIGWNYGFFAPTAERDDKKPSLPGKEFWTHYLAFAGTCFFDKERTWSASILGRYEIHTEIDDKDLTPGDEFSFEWGIGKQINTMQVGVSGYASWQVTDDEGEDAVDPEVHDRVFSIGPEIHYFFPKYKFGFQLRHLWEFDAKDRAEGHKTTFTLVKPF